MGAASFVRQMIAGICLVAVSCASLASEVWHTSTIKKVYPQADGRFVLMFDVNAAACTNGNTDKYHYVQVGQMGMTAEGVAKAYAAALFAFAMEKTVQVSFDDAANGCYIGQIIVVN